MRLLNPSDSGKLFRLDSFAGTTPGKYGDQYIYNFIDVEAKEAVTHHATKIEHLSGMKTAFKSGTALYLFKNGDHLKFEYEQNGNYPARIWQLVIQ